jgi:hypothetical protein
MLACHVGELTTKPSCQNSNETGGMPKAGFSPTEPDGEVAQSTAHSKLSIALRAG